MLDLCLIMANHTLLLFIYNNTFLIIKTSRVVYRKYSTYYYNFITFEFKIIKIRFNFKCKIRIFIEDSFIDSLLYEHLHLLYEKFISDL